MEVELYCDCNIDDGFDCLVGVRLLFFEDIFAQMLQEVTEDIEHFGVDVFAFVVHFGELEEKGLNKNKIYGVELFRVLLRRGLSSTHIFKYQIL